MQASSISVNNTKTQQQEDCPQLPGTLIRINIPAGAVINLLNLIEVSSPGGICLIVRVPLLDGGNSVSTLVNTIKQAGGTIEIVQQ
ncbi:hypothetical protein QBE52_05740 [Clostridiaceae bacterium 35-E11]